MEEDFIDIDGVDPVPATIQPENLYGEASSSGTSHPAPPGARRSTRPRTLISTYSTLRRRSLSPDISERARAARAKNIPLKPSSNGNNSGKNNKGAAAPKLKLKLGDRSTHLNTSFLGSWDRELDSDDDDLAFEEQFILRMPEGEDCERLRKMVAARDIQDDVWFKFKDSRRATFHIGQTTYNAKLVDLPAIIESQKTMDNRQMFKVADICQMLVVEDPIEDVSGDPNQDTKPTESKNFNVKDFIWPHGITPPLKHVRKRRFRKRINRATIETVEQEVERLLGEDAQAQETKVEVLENVNPDLSDSEYDNDHIFDPGTPIEHDVDHGGDVGTPLPGDEDEGEGDDEGEGEGEGEDDEDDDGFDAAFAAEIDQVENSSDEEEEDEDEEGGPKRGSDDSDDDEDDDEDDEVVQARKLLNEEVRDLEAAVEKKVAEIASVQNPLIKRRFEDALRKLRADLDSRLAQREQLSEEKRVKDRARAQIEEDSLNVGRGVHLAPPREEDEEDGEEDDEEGEDGEIPGDAASTRRATLTNAATTSEDADTPRSDAMDIG